MGEIMFDSSVEKMQKLSFRVATVPEIRGNSGESDKGLNNNLKNYREFEE